MTRPAGHRHRLEPKATRRSTPLMNHGKTANSGQSGMMLDLGMALLSVRWCEAQRGLQNKSARAASAGEVGLNEYGEGHLVAVEPFGMPLRLLARPWRPEISQR